MGLDFHKTAVKIGGMASQLQASRSQRRERLQAALRTMEQPLERKEPGPLTEESFRQRIAAAAQRKVTWLVAEPDAHGDAQQAAPLHARHQPPPAPADYAVLATDGSQIDVDRHGPAHCFLINIGGALLRYGSQPEAELFSEPHLYSLPEELVVRDPEGGIWEQTIEGPILGIKRSVMECTALLEASQGAVAGAHRDTPLLALLDGSLIFWGLRSERYPSFVRTHLLDEGLLQALEGLYELSRSRPLAFASYISRPRSTEVVNILRVAYCPHDGLETEGCDRICGREGNGKTECNDVALGLLDHDLFKKVLKPGERSAVFASQSPIVVESYGRHRVCFFYLNVGGEIARIEMPEWIAQDKNAVDLLHATLLDQCRKGRGYPVALQEAHERAVVTAADRRYFWSLVGASLEEQGITASTSEKARSKRLRAV